MRRLLLTAIVFLASPVLAEQSETVHPRDIVRVIYENADPDEYGAFGPVEIHTTVNKGATHTWISYFAYQIRVPAHGEFSEAKITLTEIEDGDNDAVVFRMLAPFSGSGIPTPAAVMTSYNAADFIASKVVPASTFTGSGTVDIDLTTEFNALVDDGDWEDEYIDGTGGWAVIVAEITTNNNDVYKWEGFEAGASEPTGPPLFIEYELATDFGHLWLFEESGSAARTDSETNPASTTQNLEPVDGTGLPPASTSLGTRSDPQNALGDGAEFAPPGGTHGRQYLRGAIDYWGCNTLDFTALFWIDNDINGNGTIAAFGEHAGGYRGWSIFTNSGIISGRISGDDDTGFTSTPINPAGDQSSATSTYSTNVSGRHMVGIIHDDSNNSVQVLFDDNSGSAAFLPTGVENWCPPPPNRLAVGAADTSDPPSFDGAVYWGAFWYRKLLQDEIDYFYNDGTGRER